MGDNPFREPVERFGPYIVRGRLGDCVHVAEGPDGPAELRLYALDPRSDVLCARFENEMHGLARLLRVTAHPAIRPICAVGTLGDTGWIAAPPFPGLTLSEWCNETPRPWSDVLAVLCAVGEAILAMHEVGLLVTELAAGDIRVDLVSQPQLDVAHAAALRLAAHRTQSDDDLREGAAEDWHVPLQGLRYIAPESLCGMSASLRMEQFVFSAVAWEALHQSPPFTVTGPAAHFRAITTGQIVAPPTSIGVPPRIRRALARGLAADPAMRWPSLRDLLAALAPHRGMFGGWGR